MIVNRYFRPSWILISLAYCLVLAIASACLGASSEDTIGDQIWGSYSELDAAPDVLTSKPPTESNYTLEVKTGNAFPEFMGDDEQVHMTSHSGGTATFSGRTTGKRCGFKVDGIKIYAGPGGGPGQPPPWHNEFYAVARIKLEINAEGDDDNFIADGDDGATLFVKIEGGASSSTYHVEFATTPQGSPAGEVGFEPTYINLSGGGSGSVTLKGLAPGGVQIKGYTPNDPKAVDGFVSGTVFKVDIKRGGNVVTNGTADVMVGEKISLTAAIQPAGLNVTSRQWTVPGNPIKYYDIDAGEIENLAQADFSGTTINFYWTTGGTGREVTCKVTVAGKERTVKSTFNVLRPAGISLTSELTSANPAVDVRPGVDNPLELVFGSTTSAGITWTGKATTPANLGAGHLGFLQLINTDNRWTIDDANSTKWKKTSGGAYVLDDVEGDAIYGSPTAIGNGDTKTHKQKDTPGSRLEDTIKKMSVTDSFKLHLMYKPSGNDSIWVTLAVLAWNWSGTAEKDAQGNWSCTQRSSPNSAPSGSDSTDLPTWDAAVSDLEDAQE
jgi:hypothetical protein